MRLLYISVASRLFQRENKENDLYTCCILLVVSVFSFFFGLHFGARDFVLVSFTIQAFTVKCTYGIQHRVIYYHVAEQLFHTECLCFFARTQHQQEQSDNLIWPRVIFIILLEWKYFYIENYWLFCEFVVLAEEMRRHWDLPENFTKII